MTNFWKNKKILITGINGFIGSNLAKKLVSYQQKYLVFTAEIIKI